MKVYDDNSTLVEAGKKYDVCIDDAIWGTSQTGNKCLKAKFRVVAGKSCGVEVKKSLPLWMVNKLAKALGFERHEDADGKGYYDVDPGDLRGKVVAVTMKHREYEGRNYNDMGDDFEGPAPKVDTSSRPVESDDGDVPF